MPDKGAFITLEGCEGSGKSTQLGKLKEYLEKGGYEFSVTREPGGTEISERVREIILDGNETRMTAETEALLFAAARAQHVSEKILPEKAAGKIVVCDRYIDSSFAYQAYARGLGYEFISGINVFAMENCMPDLTLFFDVSPDEAFARKGGADKDDRMEQSGIGFHRKVYKGYLAVAELFKERIVKIDATRTVDEIFADVVAALKERNII